MIDGFIFTAPYQEAKLQIATNKFLSSLRQCLHRDIIEEREKERLFAIFCSTSAQNSFGNIPKFAVEAHNDDELRATHTKHTDLGANTILHPKIQKFSLVFFSCIGEYTEK